MASSKRSCQKLFIVSLLFISVSLTFLVFSFHPKPDHPEFDDHSQTVAHHHKKPLSIDAQKSWFDDLIERKIFSERIRIGFVNVDDNVKHAYDHMRGQVETVNVDFRPVSGELKWEDFFPEWIDEDAQWHEPSCPEVPMPRLEDYGDLDVIVARVPCGNGTEKQGIRDLLRLQVNLVVANLAVVNGLTAGGDDRTVSVIFIGSCGPMQEIFRCDDLMTHLGEYWLYKPELRRLRQMVQMPVGSCLIAPYHKQTGNKEIQQSKMAEYSTARKLNDNELYPQRVAYVTVLHSSEAYVCGAIALAQSIIQSNSTSDLVLLHDSKLTPRSVNGLRDAGWKTKKIQPIRSPFARKDSYNEWNYSKLRLWQLTDYDKLIFIDADLILLKNMDIFFAYPQLSASPNDKVLFNSGIMVIEPSKCLFEDMMAKSKKLRSYNGGDQGFLNEVFTWWHRLPVTLNYLKIFNNGEENPDHQMKNGTYTIHFLGLKPWACYKDYDCNWDMEDRNKFASDSAHERWWKVYDTMPKKLQEFCGLTKHMDARIKKWRGIAQKANLSNGHWKISAKDPRQYHLIQ